jgi:hypothetical protein
VPAEKAPLQASHGESQARSQQKPSTQWPLRHCSAAVQAAPSSRLTTHAPATHADPGAQSAPFAQEDGHPAAVPSHTYGEQDGVPGAPSAAGRHAPTEPARSHASHEPAHATLQHTPSAQCPLAHSVPEPHATPSALRATQAPPTQVCVAAQSAAVAQVLGQALLEPSQT